MAIQGRKHQQEAGNGPAPKRFPPIVGNAPKPAQTLTSRPLLRYVSAATSSKLSQETGFLNQNLQQPPKNLREKPGFSNNEPHYKFQVELIRRWFLQ